MLTAAPHRRCSDRAITLDDMCNYKKRSAMSTTTRVCGKNAKKKSRSNVAYP